MKMFELLPRPLGSIFRKLTHLTCNSRKRTSAAVARKHRLKHRKQLAAKLRKLRVGHKSQTGKALESP